MSRHAKDFIKAEDVPVYSLPQNAIKLTKKEAREWAEFLEEDEQQVQLLFNMFIDPDYADEESIASTTKNLKTDLGNKVKTLSKEEKDEFNRLKRYFSGVARRAAFEQTDVDLLSSLATEDIKMLVGVLTYKPRFDVERYEKRITTNLSRLLLKCIRPSVRKEYLNNPQAFAPHPGFMYTASDEFGNGTTHWCQLPIPNLFKPGEEVKLLEQLRDSSEFAALRLNVVDTSILGYRAKKAMLVNQEINFATKIRDNLVDKTWLGLVKRWPLWFIGLYETKFKKPLFNHEYDDKTFFRSIGIRYRYTDANCKFYEQYLVKD